MKFKNTMIVVNLSSDLKNQIDIFEISEAHLNSKEAKFSKISKNLTNYQKQMKEQHKGGANKKKR